MKKTKRIICAVLCVLLSLSLIPLNAGAASGKVLISKDGNYKYKLLSRLPNTIELKAYVGKKKLTGKYTVPSEIDGYEVYDIGVNAFKGSEFTELRIPNVHDIGGDAFYGCKKLKKVVFGKRYRLIYGAFYNCPSLKSVYCCDDGGMWLNAKLFGFYYDKKTKTEKKVKGFAIRMKGDLRQTYWQGVDYDSVQYYAYHNDLKTVYYQKSSELERDCRFGYCGQEFYLKVDGKSVKGWKSTDSSVVSVTNDGHVKLLDSGKATIKVKLENGKVFKRTITIDESLKLTDYSEREKNYSVRVKKGYKTHIFVLGKVNSIKNVLMDRDNKIAKFANLKDSKNTDEIKITGIKKGKTTLYVKCNGIKTYAIKVTVV